MGKFLLKMMMVICAIPIVLFLLIVLFMNGVHYGSIDSYLAKDHFSKERWERLWLFRASMYTDLHEHYLKIGMPISEMKELIGDTKFRRKYVISSGQVICLDYDLGRIEAGGMSSEYDMIICPDKTGQYLESVKLIGGSYGKDDNGEELILDKDGILKTPKEYLRDSKTVLVPDKNGNIKTYGE